MGTGRGNSEEKNELSCVRSLWGAARLIYRSPDNTACFRWGTWYLDTSGHPVARLYGRFVSYSGLHALIRIPRYA